MENARKQHGHVYYIAMEPRSTEFPRLQFNFMGFLNYPHYSPVAIGDYKATFWATSAGNGTPSAGRVPVSLSSVKLGALIQCLRI